MEESAFDALEQLEAQTEGLSRSRWRIVGPDCQHPYNTATSWDREDSTRVQDPALLRDVNDGSNDFERSLQAGRLGKERSVQDGTCASHEKLICALD